VQIAGDLARTTTQVANRAEVAHPGCKAVEQEAVERLVIQLVEVLLGVFLSDRIVALGLSGFRGASNVEGSRSAAARISSVIASQGTSS